MISGCSKTGDDVDILNPDSNASISSPTARPDGLVLDGVPDEGEEEAPPVMSHAEDYEASRAQNKDVIGWISVPNTRIEYPLLRGENNDYYLTRSLTGETSKSGSVFVDYRNKDISSSRHIIIYGHNMRNGTMFHDLASYKDRDFFEANRMITVVWDNQEVKYEIYAAYIVSTDINFIRTDFANDSEFLDYMNQLKALSKFDAKPTVELTKDDQIITLVTCTYEYDESRYAVQARRIDS